MAKKVKIIVSDDEEEKDNLTYKKNVVMSIVSLAAQEINGVSSISRSSVSLLKSALSKNISRGIVIDFDENVVHIDVYLNLKFGYSVKDVAFRVQENIKSSVESMTEYKVGKVNVHIVSVNFSEIDSDFVS